MKGAVFDRPAALLRRENGLTMLELLLVAAILGTVTLAAVRLVVPMITFIRRAPARQSAQMQMRACMETMERVLSNGKAGTLVIATPPTTPTIQFSSATFQSQDGSGYTIYWSPSPVNSVHLQRTPPGGTPSDTVLATNITALVFGVAGNDPGLITVTLQMTVPLDSSGSPGSFFTILLPTQTIRMISS